MRVLVAELLGDRFGGGDTLVAGLVREPRRSGDVADRPDAGHVRAAHRVGVDVTLGRRHAERLETDVLGVGNDADRDNAVAELLLSGLAVRSLDPGSDDLRVGLEALDARAGEDRQPLL